MIPAAEQRLQRIGLALLITGCVIGSLLIVIWLLPVVVANGACGAMCLGAVLAFPAAAVYLTVPRLLDRYDPEPWYALVGCLLWGGLAAAGFSLAINSEVGALVLAFGGERASIFVSTVISAPIVEELFKAIGLFGVFYFLRREFDGVVDGIIYATFIAIGFAAVENVIYYARATQAGELNQTFFMRGILFPWGHPVYTSMTGIGFGLSRESDKRWVQRAGPLLGYCGAVMLHAMWNGSATLAESQDGALMFVCSLPLWFLFVVSFIVMVGVLVRRRGKVIRAYLTDEVALGNLSAAEVDLVCDPFGVAKARYRHGPLGASFVRAAARLALSKWHATRAHRQQKHTVSMDFIVPLRHRLKDLRDEYIQRSRSGQ